MSELSADIEPTTLRREHTLAATPQMTLHKKH